LLGDGIAKILHSANFRIVASISSADDLPGRVQADAPLFLIVHTDDDFDFAAREIEFLRDSYPDGRIVIVADRYRPEELVAAFRAGANGCFVDVMSCDVFIRSLELVMMGETVLPPAFLSYVFGAEGRQLRNDSPSDDDKQTILVTGIDGPAPLLSPRERLILRCLIEGGSNKCIARKMDIAEATVKVHVKAILRKIRVHNRTQAAIWGMNNGCLSGTTGALAPPLSSAIADRLPNAIGPSSQGAQISEPDCLTLIAQTNHAEVPRIERLIRKDANLRAEAAIRSRK
jgi:two-component system nitrate/nitrite response regulator NarL